MKSLRVFLCLLVAGALMTACEKEKVNKSEEIIDSKFSKEKFAEEFIKYNEKHDELKIEYTSLEEMNIIYARYGMEPVTLEDLGVTEEEYNIAQENINSNARWNCIWDPSKCQFPVQSNAIFLGDISGNGALSTFDIIKIKLEWTICCQTQPSSNSTNFDVTKFGWFSSAQSLWPSPDGNDSVFCNDDDIWIVHKIVLGLYPCDQNDCFS